MRIANQRARTMACAAFLPMLFATLAVAATEQIFQDEFGCIGAAACAGTATPVCCAAVTVGAGTPPGCPQTVSEGGCTTAAACTTSLSGTCPASETVQLCQASTECTDPNHPSCCAFPNGITTASYCVDSFTAQFASQCF